MLRLCQFSIAQHAISGATPTADANHDFGQAVVEAAERGRRRIAADGWRDRRPIQTKLVLDGGSQRLALGHLCTARHLGMGLRVGSQDGSGSVCGVGGGNGGGIGASSRRC